MSAAQILDNVAAYALQIGLLVGIGAALPALLRLKAPGARLFYWQLLLVACLALPWVRPWHSETITVATGPALTAPFATHATTIAPMRPVMPPVTEVALWLLAAGVAVRLAWLAVGLLKLARYRRKGRAMPLPPEWIATAQHTQLLISDEIGGPVTFGFLRPVVLLPAGFPTMAEAMRDAILFHELIHVERRDWLFTLGEELVRAVFWFHPAIWWVLGEIQLAREQTVDRAVIEMTQARDPYVDTLLAMAGVNPEMDLAPAPLFLRRRHLKQRVMGIVQEVRMSKTRLILAQAAALAMMAVACWFITGAVPLEAQPQIVGIADGPGVTVNLNGSQLMHRTAVMYPAEALAKGVEGTVVVQVRLDANGEVIDDAILSGPDELRKGVQQSVLNWHFERSGSATRVVNVDFVKPAMQPVNGYSPNTPPPPAAIRAQIAATSPAPGGRGGPVGTAVPEDGPQSDASISAQYEALQRLAQQRQQSGSTSADQQAQIAQVQALLAEFKKRYAGQLPETSTGQNRRIEAIEVLGLSDSAREQLLAQLPVHVGDAISEDARSRLIETVRRFDQHLMISFGTTSSPGWNLLIKTPDAVFTNTPGPIPAGAQKIGGNVMAVNLINATRPVYPPLAKMARQQGTVKFQATIGTDGKVEALQVISGPPLLVQASVDAVKKWVYQPTLLNGAPVEVVTTVDVNFTLADGGTPAQ